MYSITLNTFENKIWKENFNKIYQIRTLILLLYVACLLMKVHKVTLHTTQKL